MNHGRLATLGLARKLHRTRVLTQICKLLRNRPPGIGTTTTTATANATATASLCEGPLQVGLTL